MTSNPPVLPGPIVANKLATFNILETHYKHLSPTHPLPASILIPKTLTPNPSSPTKVPLAIYWHGGALVLGQRLYPDWFPIWIPAFTTTHNAILISPDYRLLPEHTGTEILTDVRDFFAWVHDTSSSGLAAALPAGIEVDTSNILVAGGSAGGYLAVQSGLLDLPAQQRSAIKAVIAQYPMLDMRAPWYTENYEKNLFSAGPNLPPELLQDFLDDLKGDEIVTERIPPDGSMLSASIFGQGLFPKFLGMATELYPLEVLKRRAEAGERVPPMWVLHGTEDDVVPVDGTRAFEKVWVKVLPEGGEGLHVNYEPGAHGFDDPATLETEWVRKGVAFVEQFWPAKR